MAYMLDPRLYQAVRQIVREWFKDPNNNLGRKYPPSEPQREGFWVKLNGNEPISTNFWEYSGIEQRRTASGFEDKPGGRTVEGAINSVEAFNSASGVQGNGVDISAADFPAGMELKPADTGTPVVWMIKEYLYEDSTPCYTFQFENAVDGPCEAAE